MEIIIDGSSFDYRTDYQDDKTLRGSFDALAQQTFGFSFEAWYRSGNWTDRYRPYSLLQNGQVVANISVSPMDLNYMGQELHCVQLGTVMTAPALRNRGLIHFLMAQVLNDWTSKCDGVYLYANQEVLDFYPKFGFAPVREWRHSLALSGDEKRHGVRRIIAGVTEDRLLLLKKYAQSNPFSLLSAEHNPGLLLFHCCFGSMRTCVYYMEEYGVVAIAESQGDSLYCYDIFGTTSATLCQVLTALSGPETRKTVLGFTPKAGSACSVRPLREKDCTLFVLGGKNLFQGKQMRLPALFRT
ncbi:MAG: GNAT family N-acetyltransferase [Oscillospiraceae bacterium]|nr:GNAT family N-acetyltransferase [Oscillospiraceae bacterium]